MKEIVFYISLCLPTYIFFFVLYIIIKKKSTDKTLKTYYFDIDKDISHDFGKIDKIMNFIYFRVLALVLMPLISFIIASIIYKNLLILSKYLVSADALRFLKYMSESLLTVTLSVIGLVAVFSSLNKKYYIFFDTKDIFKFWKVKEKIVSIVFYFVLTMIGVMSYYFYYYILGDIETIQGFMIISFIFSSFSTIALTYNLFQLLRTILRFLLVDKYEFALLERLYYRVHDTKRKKSEKLNVNNFVEIESNIYYLMSKYIKTNKVEKIEYIFFPNEYKSFSIGIKIRNFLRSLCVTIFGSFLFGFSAYVIFPKEVNIIIMLLIFLIFNFITCLVIYSLGGFRDMLIFVNMDSFGFRVKKDNHFVYCSTIKRGFTKNSYNKYFKSLYNIVSLFRDVLNADNELVSLCYKTIVGSENTDYLLYSICTFLYYDRYKPKMKKYLWDFKQYLMDNKIDINMVKNNTSAVITDIVRDNSIKNKVEDFFNQIEKSHRIELYKHYDSVRYKFKSNLVFDLFLLK